MGFFQDLKEDLSLAVNELLPEEEKAVDQAAEDQLIEEEDTNLDETMKELEAVLAAEFVEKPQKTAEDTKSDSIMDVAASQLAGIAGIVRRENHETAEESVVSATPEMEMEMQTVALAEEVAKPESAVVPESVAVSEPVVAQESVAESQPVAEPEMTEAPLPETIEVPQTKAVAEIDESEERKQQPIEEMLGELASPVNAAVMQEEKTETKLEKEVGKVIDKQRMNLADEAVSDEEAVITVGMEIAGDIVSKGSVRVEGSVRGNIEVLGKLNVSGKVEGDSKAAEVFADSAHIIGTIVAEGTVKIGEDSVVIGNVQATSAVIAGAIKGDLDVHGPVILDSRAIVMGNIKSKSVQINNGATIEGMCSQCYAETSPTAFFESLTKKK